MLTSINMAGLVHPGHRYGKSEGDTMTQRVNSDGGNFRRNDRPLDVLQQVDGVLIEGPI